MMVQRHQQNLIFIQANQVPRRGNWWSDLHSVCQLTALCTGWTGTTTESWRLAGVWRSYRRVCVRTKSRWELGQLGHVINENINLTTNWNKRGNKSASNFFMLWVFLYWSPHYSSVPSPPALSLISGSTLFPSQHIEPLSPLRNQIRLLWAPAATPLFCRETYGKQFTAYVTLFLNLLQHKYV